MSDFKSLPKRLFEDIESHPDVIKHFERDAQNVYQPTTNAEFKEVLLKFSKALLHLGVEFGDRIAIMASTQAKWSYAHLGAQCVGGIAAGIYHTCSPDQVDYIVNDCAAKVLLYDDQALMNQNESIINSLGSVVQFVVMNGEVTHERAISWDQLLELGAEIEDQAVYDRIDLIKPETCVTLIYTSGTTGPPKGVMLSSGNAEYVGRLLSETFKEDFNIPEESDYISYLPLSHVAEQAFTIFGPCCTPGRRVFYCRDTAQLTATIAEVKPHVLFAPPRLWEKFFAGITAKLPQGVPITALPDQNKAGIRAMMGFDRICLAMTGAAPISANILKFFFELGITISEVYGQSEGSGPTTCNTPGNTKFGSVGKPLPQTEVVIAEDNELLFRGPQVFLGYWNLDDKTAETLDSDGFVHSGDLARFDEEGYVHIIGRKKDIIITSGGKNITPINMENALKEHPLIGAAVVVGEGRPYLNALISLDMDVVAAVAAKNGITVEQFLASPGPLQAVTAHIEATNPHFNRQEQIKKFKILDEPLSIENGTLTPTTKVKRNIVNEYYADIIEQLYAEEE